MRSLIPGAGAIGGYYGVQLVEAGADVSFLVRPRRAAQLARDGLQVESRGRRLHRAVPSLQAGQAAAPFDLVLLTCKAYDLGEAVEAIAPPMRSCRSTMPGAPPASRSPAPTPPERHRHGAIEHGAARPATETAPALRYGNADAAGARAVPPMGRKIAIQRASRA